MTKTFCDKCGRTMDPNNEENYSIQIYRWTALKGTRDLCKDCINNVLSFIDHKNIYDHYDQLGGALNG